MQCHICNPAYCMDKLHCKCGVQHGSSCCIMLSLSGMLQQLYPAAVDGYFACAVSNTRQRRTYDSARATSNIGAALPFCMQSAMVIWTFCGVVQAAPDCHLPLHAYQLASFMCHPVQCAQGIDIALLLVVAVLQNTMTTTGRLANAKSSRCFVCLLVCTSATFIGNARWIAAYMWTPYLCSNICHVK